MIINQCEFIQQIKKRVKKGMEKDMTSEINEEKNCPCFG